MPDSIKLFFKGMELSDPHELLVHYGIQSGDVLQLTANLIEITDCCVVCAENLPVYPPFPCGHMNLCESCQEVVQVCPQCSE